MSCRVVAAAVGLGLLGTLAFGQNLRGLVVEEVRVPADAAYEKTVGISLEEMAALSLEGDARFLRGIRLELLLSNLLKQHFDTFALAVYRRLSPEPRKEVRAYQGERIFFQDLPYLNRILVQLPLGGEEDGPAGEAAGESASARSGESANERSGEGIYRLPAPLSREDFPLLVVILPLTKGIPDTVAEARFRLTVRPVVARRGTIQLSLRAPAGAPAGPITAYLDERELSPAELQAFKDGQELPAGLHRLRLVSPGLQEVNTSFTVEPGKASALDIELQSLATLLSIEAPQDAEVFLDGEKLTGLSGLPIAEGNHQVRVKIADYNLTRKFSAQPGRHYHLSCIFDIIISED
jgi:hypothetical protein